MVSIRYFSPAPQLRGLISSYYWFESDQPLLADRLRAELGQVRFIVEGSLRYGYDDGRAVECPRALIAGPTLGPVATLARGPFRLFGAGLMPAGWSKLIGIAADALADTATDLGGVVGGGADATLQALGNARDDAARITVIDRFFLALQAKGHATPSWFTTLADEWLTATADPKVDCLIEQAGMSARQVERWTRRYYGASPKLLARKYRALQAAVRLGTRDVPSWTDAAGDAFYDQSHFIREFKQFVGMTPSHFLANTAPVSRLTIARRRLLPGLPKLALYS